MQKFDSNLILLIFVELAVVYLLAAMLAADGWVIYRLFTGKPVLPRSPLVAPRPVPWGAWTVLLVLVIPYLLPQVVFLGYAKLNRLLPSRSQARLRAAMAQNPPALPDGNQSQRDRTAESETKPADAHLGPVNVQPAEKAKQAIPKPNEQPAAPRGTLSSKNELTLSSTENMVIGGVSSVILLGLVPLLLRLTSRSPARDLGLSFEKWWRQAAVGVVAFLAIEPLLMAIQFATVRLWESNAHPLLKMVQDEFSPGVLQLAILMAVFIAPVCEEVLFRGIIQSWVVTQLDRLRSEPEPVPVDSLAITASQALPAADYTNSQTELREPGTDPFPAALERPSGPSPHTPSRTVNHQSLSSKLGIIATSVIFAALHWEQWPAPIPIFLLAVVIGIVYQRTGSLIAAICMHAMFNGLSMLFLMGMLLLPQPPPHPELETVKSPAIIATFSAPRDCACIHCKK